MIGVLDSGIGGLTVVRELMQQLNGYDLLYFGDTARTPYGCKSRSTLLAYAREITQFLLAQGARVIVVACNSVSSIAAEDIRAHFRVPVFEVITPAVTLALERSRGFRIGVVGTRATITSGIYETKIRSVQKGAKVYSAACPLLVPLVEEGWCNRPETTMIVKKYLHPLKVRQVDTLILGCTHYPLLRDVIQRKIGKRVALVDSAEGVAASVKAYLAVHPEIDGAMHRSGNIRFFVSDLTEMVSATARMILKQKVRLEQVGIGQVEG